MSFFFKRRPEPCPGALFAEAAGGSRGGGSGMARDWQAAMRAVCRGELEPRRTAGADIPRRSGGWRGPCGAQYALLDPRATGQGDRPPFSREPPWRQTDSWTDSRTDGRELCATASKYLQTLGGFTSGGRGHRDTITSNEHVLWSH